MPVLIVGGQGSRAAIEAAERQELNHLVGIARTDSCKIHARKASQSHNDLEPPDKLRKIKAPADLPGLSNY